MPSMKLSKSSRTKPCPASSKNSSNSAKSVSPLRRKKQSLRQNGSDRVTVRTRHGMFVFRRQRFLTSEGQNLCLLPELMSSILQKRCVDWATRFCYGEGARLLEEYCGSALLSEDSLWRLVMQQAARLDTEQADSIVAVTEQSEVALPSPLFTAVTESGLYDGEVAEFVALTDAICVASQKPTRQKAGQTRIEKE